ncbi:MAG: peptidylprolyl isomerase [Gammaproteobacteria bacterium]|nr:peptidylprolyl isomerase [Gammaproteobacteria bacterium]
MKYIRVAFLVCCSILAHQAHAQDKSSEILLDRIVAVVNEGVVLQSELARQLETANRNLNAQNIPPPPPEILRRQVLESLILRQIQLQRADRLGLAISDEEVNRSLELLAQRNGLTLSELPAALSIQGLDYSHYRTELREDMVLDQLRMRDVGSRISITRSEVDKIIAKNAPDDIEYEVLHLLISVASDASEETISEAAKISEELVTRLNDGEDFGPLAISYSASPGVLTDHGNLGYLKANALPSIFADTVVTMTPGQTAPPIRSASGFHVVQLSDIRGVEKVMTDQRLARHILIQPNQVVTSEQAKQKLVDILARLNDGEDFATIAAAESDDASGASAGGELGWASLGNFVPEFEAQLDALEKMEISEPFETPFGWHIVQLLDTRTYDSTLDVRRNQAAVTLRERKFEEEAQDWIRQLRDEAYVEIRLDGSS